jgi:hypothetical protein
MKLPAWFSQQLGQDCFRVEYDVGVEDVPCPGPRILRLQLRKPGTGRKVRIADESVDTARTRVTSACMAHSLTCPAVELL